MLFIGVPGTTLRKDALKYSKKIKSFYRFLTGGAGATISRVIKNITMTLNKGLVATMISQGY